jgi:hypothetical protein
VKQREPYLDTLRTLACMLVVLGFWLRRHSGARTVVKNVVVPLVIITVVAVAGHRTGGHNRHEPGGLHSGVVRVVVVLRGCATYKIVAFR